MVRTSKSRFARVLLPTLIITAVGVGCSFIENKTPAAETAPMPGNTTIAETPFVEVTTSQPMETEIAPEKGIMQIDVAKVVYPPVGSVKENFEKGEYDAGVETIKKWVSVWENMGIFEGLEIENNSIGIAPLDGRAGLVCADTRKSGEWVGTLLCPPLDLEKGGLKAVPAEGEWDETDKPLLITLENLDELISKGVETDLTYQFINKYQKYPIKYVDPKTGRYLEGRYLEKMGVMENEVIKESVVCVAKEYCMGGQMEVDQEVAKVFYEKLIDALLHSDVNEEYFNILLNGDISLDALTNYIEVNNGMMPVGLKMMSVYKGQYFEMVDILDIPINLSAIKTIVFGPKEWQSNVSGIREHLEKYNDSQLTNPFYTTKYAWMYYGWYIDENGYLVLVNGSKDVDPNNFPGVIGGDSGEYLPERDNKAATAQALGPIKFLEIFLEGDRITIFPFDDQVPSSVNEGDIQKLLGGRYLFKQVGK